MKRIIVILFLLFSIYINAQGDTLHYKIMSSTIQIGNLTVIKTQDKNNIKINIKSDVKVKMLINVDVKYELSCTYKNNELVTSSAIVYKNGKVHSTSKTVKNGTYYVVSNNNKISKFHNKIDYSGALLFFDEPINIASVFSESELVVKPIKSIGPNTYDIINPTNGKINEYYYTNGVLEKAVVYHTLMNYTLIKEDKN